jgi:hypothetical protein
MGFPVATDELISSRLPDVAAQYAHLIPQSRTWIHRRVDYLSFTEQYMVQRRISIDFTIPQGAQAFVPSDGGPGTYYLPVSLLVKWPPVMRFDFRDDVGAPVPLLTSRKNRAVDAAVLRKLAPANPPSTRVPELEEALTAIAASRDVEARQALDRFAAALGPYSTGLSDADREAWRQVKNLAALLVENSLLWVRVSGVPGDRKVVKFGFEDPVERQLVLWRRLLSALSWRPTTFVYEVPHLSLAMSYHLQIDAPAGLAMHYPDIYLDDPRPTRRALMPETPDTDRASLTGPALRTFVAGGAIAIRQALRDAGISARAKARKAREGLTPTDPLPRRAPHFDEPAPGAKYVWNTGRRAYMYVSNPRHRYALVRVEMRAQKHGLVTPAVAAAFLIAALLTWFAAGAGAISSHIEPAVTVLLLVPGLLGYLVVRPGEHPLVRRHLGGVRAVALISGSLPVIAALILLSSRHPTTLQLRVGWGLLAFVAWLLAAVLVLSWVLPLPPDVAREEEP